MGNKFNTVARCIAALEYVSAFMFTIFAIVHFMFYLVDLDGFEFLPTSALKPETKGCISILVTLMTPISISLAVGLSDAIGGETNIISRPVDLRKFQILYAVQTIFFLGAGLMLSCCIPFNVSVLFLAYRFTIALPFTSYYFDQKIASSGEKRFDQMSHLPALKTPAVNNTVRNESPPPGYETLELSV